MYYEKKSNNIIYVLLLNTMAFFSITTLSYNLWPKWLSINRVIGTFIFVEILYIYLITLRKKDLVILGLSLFFSAFSFVFSKDYIKNGTDLIYFLVTILLLWKITDCNVLLKLTMALNKLLKNLKLVVLLNNILIIMGFFWGDFTSNGIGNSLYYKGFTNSPHTFCAGICMNLVFTIVILRNKRIKLVDVIYFIPGIIGVLESGARIYLISITIIMLLFYRYFVKTTSLKVLITPILIIIAIYVFYKSNMIDKFFAVFRRATGDFNTNELIDNFSSGRIKFWQIDLSAFKNNDLIHKILGNGFDYVYYINKNYYGIEIWAHNDIIDILLSIGIAGLVFYLYIFTKLSKLIRCVINEKFKSFLLISYCVIFMMINGFFAYQHYLYSFIVLILVLINNNKSVRFINKKGARNVIKHNNTNI